MKDDDDFNNKNNDNKSNNNDNSYDQYQNQILKWLRKQSCQKLVRKWGITSLKVKFKIPNSENGDNIQLTKKY